MDIRYSKSLRQSIFIIGYSIFISLAVSAQEPADKERPSRFWATCVEKARLDLKLNESDFQLFYQFEGSRIDTIRGSLMRKAADAKSDSEGDLLLKSGEIEIINLYKEFQQVKLSYPSSVEDFAKYDKHRVQTPCDTLGCYNIGFEQGTLDGWNAYYAYNDNPFFNYFNITNITGGPAGAVTIAANDTLTSNPNFYNPGLPPNKRPDYQIFVESGFGTDALVPAITKVSPFGGLYSVLLGDTTQVNYGVAMLSRSFIVKPGNTDFTYQYAVVLENPGSHTYYQQPFFQVALLDQNGDTIPSCGSYFVVSSGGASNGWNSVYVPPNGTIGNDTAYYKNWTVVAVPLKKYIGQCITIAFVAGDCGKGGHFGYAYVDASCAPLEILASSPSFCGQKTIKLTGPPGFTQYIWSGPPGGIKGPNNTQIITIDSSGTYKLLAVPVTGVNCADTLTINVKDTGGHMPTPSFTTNMACLGQPMKFFNTSNPVGGPGVKFYWDFYNLGSFQDSTVNAQWTYNTPGTYHVKLYEDNRGCGADTVITVTVAPPPDVTISSPPFVCVGDSVTLTANILSSFTPNCYWKWNNGATTKSITVQGVPSDTSFYVVTTCGCPDTAYQHLHVYPTGTVTACCDTTITAGDTILLNAWGDVKYNWSPNTGVFCPTCGVSPAQPFVNTSYTVSALDKNGCPSEAVVNVNVESCDYFWIPDAFTPNDDGRNELFKPLGWCMKSYTMYIFNRWGELIFHTDDSMPWDGRYKGRVVQEDVYVCRIIITTWDLRQHLYIGNVTLLK